MRARSEPSQPAGMDFRLLPHAVYNTRNPPGSPGRRAPLRPGENRMRTIHPFRLPALLLAGALAMPAAAQNGAVAVDASHLRSLQARLDSVAAVLPPQECAA